MSDKWRCVVHRHQYPSRLADDPSIPQHGPNEPGFDIGLAWCSVVHEEWHDDIDLNTTDCVFRSPPKS